MCDYKIILIGAITSLFSQDITIYDDVNEWQFIVCLEKTEESNSSGKDHQFYSTGDNPDKTDRKAKVQKPRN